jgi:membrane-associated phospholipid phosphatase
MLAAAALPTFTVRWEWRDALFDLLGLVCILGGTFLITAAKEQRVGSGLSSVLVGVLALCAGVEFLVDGSARSVLWMSVFLVTVGRPLWRWGLGPHSRLRSQPILSQWCRGARQYAVVRGTLLCGVVALALVIEMLQVAVSPGGPKAHALELGTFGVLLSLVGVGWAAATDALQVFVRTGQSRFTPSPTVGANLTVGSLLLFGLFFLLILAIQNPSVQDFDALFGRMAYKCWGQPTTQVLRQISNAGGRDLAVFWIPAVLVLLTIRSRRHSLRFFAAAMFGTLGLETVFKTLSHRLRPEFTRGVHFDSFPSGHALAATILAGLLLVLFLPTCRYSWQRVSLWIGAVTWPLLMAFSRVYTGRHYLTDVLGALLLGSAWVCLCTGLCLWLNEIGFGTRQPQAAHGDELAKCSEACPTSRHLPDCGQRKRCGS